MKAGPKLLPMIQSLPLEPRVLMEAKFTVRVTSGAAYEKTPVGEHAAWPATVTHTW